MNYSKRERYIGIATAAVIGMLLFDQIIYSPLTDRLTAADTRVQAAQLALTEANNTFDKSTRDRRRWRDIAGDAVKDNAPAAESQALNRVREWAQNAGLTLTSLKPTRGETAKGYDRIIVQATGTGTTSQISRFLYAAQTASIPARVTELDLSTRKEGTDDLSMQVSIATIYTAAVTNPVGGRP